MTLFKNKYRIESIRLRGYDYGSPGAYFVTINTKNRIRWFGNVVDGGMNRTDAGNIAHRCWLSIPAHHRNVALDEFVVMPDHVHGIVVITKQIDGDVAWEGDVAGVEGTGDVAGNVSTKNKIPSPKSGSLPAIVRSFKSAVSNEIHRAGRTNFAWQSLYYDHIVRNENDLNRIRDYIINNPLMWYYSRTNPNDVKIQDE